MRDPKITTGCPVRYVGDVLKAQGKLDEALKAYRDSLAIPDYIYTEAERKKLAQLKIFARTFTHYAGYSVTELINIASRFVADLDYEDEESLKELRAWRPTDLKLRQIAHLASLCRVSDELEYDQEIHALLASAYPSDTDEDNQRRSSRDSRPSRF